MKHEIDLVKYRNVLEELVKEKKLTQDTANTYYSCMKIIAEHCQTVDAQHLKHFLVNKAKNKKQLMKYIAAIRKYEDYVLEHSKGILFGEPEGLLFQHFKAKGANAPVEMKYSEESLARKINGLKNRKLKYALRLQLKSGLRVSEIAKLTKDDLFFENGKIEIHVRSGKGRKAREVKVLDDPYLYVRLPEYIKACKEDRLFYSRDYLRIKAAEYDIATHDLRRANAKARLKGEMEKGKSRTEAKRVVQQELGHESTRITDLYISAKVRKDKKS